MRTKITGGQLDKVLLAIKRRRTKVQLEDQIADFLVGLESCIGDECNAQEEKEGRQEKVATKRHTQLFLTTKQRAMWDSQARFVVAPCGRRSGKTELLKRKTIKEAARQPFGSEAWYVLGAPTYTQAKRIFWRDMKRLLPAWMLACKPSESELTLTLVNGAQITVMGMDAPERAEGRPMDGLGLDEFGNMREEVWHEHLRASLVDKQGWACFTGVPEGRNHYHELYQDARADDSGDWDVFHWTTMDVLHLYLGREAADKEIESARRSMDQLTFEQEFLASFISFHGLAYYGFGPDNCVKGLPYDVNGDLILCFDFNVAPGVAAIIQETPTQTHVIGEVHIPRNSNTPAVCARITKDWGNHKGNVYCYGDSTGGARGTAKVQGSDWELIRNELRPVFGQRLRFRVPKANPRERVRVNAVNSRVCTQSGERHLLVDPTKAPNVVKDFEGVRTLEGGSGEIDKKSDPKLTHPTDAIGYFITRAHPVKTGLGVRSQTV